MKKRINLFLALLLFGNAFGQTNVIPPGVPTKAQLEQERKNHDCIHRYNKSLGIRLKYYPFNKTSQIKLVSFYQDTTADHKIGLPTENDTICYSKLNELINLSLEQIDSLTDILFNIGFRGKTFRISEMSCYIPRNGILFIDPEGKIFEYIEFCFECEKASASSGRIELGEMCEQKFDLLKKFFRKAGIKYGTEMQ